MKGLCFLRRLFSKVHFLQITLNLLIYLRRFFIDFRFSTKINRKHKTVHATEGSFQQIIKLFGFVDGKIIHFFTYEHILLNVSSAPDLQHSEYVGLDIFYPFCCFILQFQSQPYLYTVMKRHAAIVKMCSFNNLKVLGVPPVAKQASPLLCFLPFRASLK